MNKKYKNTKGITLVALVITIIVLLILAGVSIATLTRENGIFIRADNAKKETEIQEIIERARLDIVNWKTEKYLKGENTNVSVNTVKELLEGKDYIKEIVGEDIITRSGYKIPIQNIINSNNIIESNGPDSIEVSQVTDTTPGSLAGEGSQDSPYLIESIEDLVFLSVSTNSGTTYKGKIVKLNVDLDFESIKSYIDSETTSFGDLNNDGTIKGLKAELTERTGRTNEYQEGFIPIGKEYSKEYQGSFDGNDKWIKNIYIGSCNSISQNSYGLFGKSEESGNFINNVKISGEYNIEHIKTTWVTPEIGSIVGNSSMINIENCLSYVNIESKGNTSIGGIVGSTDSGSISKCINYGNIKAAENCSYIGGIIGMYNLDYIEDCMNFGNIDAEGVNGVRRNYRNF